MDDQRRSDWVERYLDAEPDAQRTLELRLDGDTEARDALALQRSIDDALCRRLAPPSPARIRSIVEDAMSDPAPSSSWRIVIRRFAIAAVFVASVFTMWQSVRAWRADDPAGYTARAWRDAAGTYAMVLENSSRPDWVCADDEEFSRTFFDQFGASLVIRSPDPEVRLLGLSRVNCITRRTMCLLLDVRGSLGLVLIDHADRDRELDVPADAGIELTRSAFGDLVLYVIAPKDEPWQLDLYDSANTARPRARLSRDPEAP